MQIKEEMIGFGNAKRCILKEESKAIWKPNVGKS